MSEDTKPTAGAYTLARTVHKADTALVTTASEAFPEDAFEGLYYAQGEGNAPTVAIMEPQYKPCVLHALCSQNNTLRQCVEAMEVNIDGTGHSIEPIDPEDLNEAEMQVLKDFFNEPYPSRSMVEIRRAVRADVEETGMGYMEIIRDALDNVVMANHLPATNMRLLRYDAPVMVTKEIIRAGKPVKVSMMTRERRLVQRINGKNTFFKEFGASRDLNRKTGQWFDPKTAKSTKAARLPVTQRASEILIFEGNQEPKSPYSSPRWINQLPSVLGSRKAEEFNLEFFDAGGIPPAIILVQGGYLGETLKQDLTAKLSSKTSNSRVVVVEAVSASGSLDSSGTVSMRVERFGSERQSDSMFQSYDKNCEEHVRVGFRLPPMFIGKAQDYNFATAHTAYMVAEAQVFLPEREEFDNKINRTIVKALGVKKYQFRSLPMTLVDIDKQIAALGLVAGKFISGEETVKRLNEITGLSMQYEEQKAPAPEPTPEPAPSNDQTGVGEAPVNKVSENQDPVEEDLLPENTSKSEKVADLIAMATRWAGAVGITGKPDPNANLVTLKNEISALSTEDNNAFLEALSAITMANAGVDTEGLAHLCGCAAGLE